MKAKNGTPEQIAKLLETSVSVVKKLGRLNKIPRMRVNRTFTYDKKYVSENLDALKEECKNASRDYHRLLDFKKDHPKVEKKTVTYQVMSEEEQAKYPKFPDIPREALPEHPTDLRCMPFQHTVIEDLRDEEPAKVQGTSDPLVFELTKYISDIDRCNRIADDIRLNADKKVLQYVAQIKELEARIEHVKGLIDTVEKDELSVYIRDNSYNS